MTKRARIQDWLEKLRKEEREKWLPLAQNILIYSACPKFCSLLPVGDNFTINIDVDGSLSKLDSAKRNYCSDENQVIDKVYSYLQQFSDNSGQKRFNSKLYEQ